MSTSSRICTTVLRFTVLLCCWLQAHAANVTVSDTDPSIVYSPVESWSPSSNLCSMCLNPGSMSYHEAINSAPGSGSTVLSTNSTSTTSTSTAPPLPPPTTPTSSPSLGGRPPSTVSSLSSSPSSPPPAPNPVITSQKSSPPTVASPPPSPSPTEDGGGGDHGSGKDHRDLARQLTNGTGSVNTPVTLSYNFTGTAIYLFSIQPPSGSHVGGTPMKMNLFFTLDNQPAGNYSPTETSKVFMPNTSVLSLTGLSNQSHQLVVTVGNNSVFLFDYLIYTDISDAISTPETSDNDKKNNIATFAGALGGSVGVLSLFSLGIAISIIRRRCIASRRDRLDNEANPISDTASMSGPMPFVPRFFPDTIIPQDPPNYNDALSSNHNNTPLLASLVSSVYTSRQRSYADIPPSTSPPPLEESPPPPFPMALSTPVLDLPSGDSIPSISTPTQTDQGSDTSSVISPHEDTPLLRSSEFDTRPRTSTRSHEPSENSETTFRQEDAS